MSKSPSTAPRPAGFTAYMRALGAKGGRIGGRRHLETMTPTQRTTVARKAAQARWSKKKIATP